MGWDAFGVRENAAIENDIHPLLGHIKIYQK